MGVARSTGRLGIANSIVLSALRFAGYDYDCSPPKLEAKEGAKAAVSAGGRYMHALPAEVEPIRTFLVEYSGIRPGDVDEHVYQIRDRLWDIYPYACVGHFRFVSMTFAADPYYQLALHRLLQGQVEGEKETRLLDVGCCMGQVLRKLASDGVDSTRLYGTDIEPRFLDAGYDLFKDRDKFKATFVIGNLLKQEEGDEGLDALDGKISFIHATSFFHLFTWDDQVHAAVRMLRFLDPEQKDVMIFGRQVGTMLPRNHGKAGSDKVFLHNAHSWQMLWDEIGERTGTKWRVTMEPTEKIETGAGGVESSLRKMSFCVFRA
ncbi:hypothetical protein F5Y19DRAFT_235820 [Xylariaceae sp. FL1651]|nr:hypothetical protein F5Y19DRAFT_235820 [Xylariaceae sp. FL1651]